MKFFYKNKKFRERDARPLIQKLHLMYLSSAPIYEFPERNSGCCPYDADWKAVRWLLGWRLTEKDTLVLLKNIPGLEQRLDQM